METIAQTSRPIAKDESRTPWNETLTPKQRILVGIFLVVVGLFLFGGVRTILRSYRSRAAAELAAAQRAAIGIPVLATEAYKGDLAVRLTSLGSIDSSNFAIFSIAQDAVQEVVKRFDAGQLLRVEADDSAGKPFGHGSLRGVDNQIDTATGTLKCTATLVPDEDKLMVPGTFLRIHLLLGVKHGVTIVPAEAIVRDTQSAFVWAIKPDQTVDRRTVQVATMEEQDLLRRLVVPRDQEGTIGGAKAAIQTGLSPGELVVVGPADANLHEGQKVRYKLVSYPESSEANPQPAPLSYQWTFGPTDHPGQIPEWITLKALNGWVADLQSSDPSAQKLAERAIAELGTNALPEFLKILDDRDRTPEGDTRRYNTAAALRFIGPDLKSWIPSFNSLMLSGNEQTAYAGARALASTTPIVPEAFAQLTNGLVNPAAGVRDAASHGVGLLLGSESNHLAESALPILLHNLKDKAQFVRADTAGALMMYVQYQQTHGHDAKPNLIVPSMIELLQDPYSYCRQDAEWALKDYGQDAVPVLLKLINDPDSRVREAATNAMSKIGSGLGSRPTTLKPTLPEAVEKQ